MGKEESEVGMMCGTYGTYWSAFKFNSKMFRCIQRFGGETEGKEQLGRPGVYGRIILKISVQVLLWKGMNLVFLV
jgi:hypothetical protein